MTTKAVKAKMNIPVCAPYLSGNEEKYVVDCIRSGWISGTGGDYLKKFEQGFAEYCECKYGVAVSSGTAALHIALLSLGIGEGDEVIVPTFTMAASAFAVSYTGAKPVFVDCGPDTWNMDVEKVEAAITDNTRAVMPVHIYGHPCEMFKLRELSYLHSLFVVEDAAEAHGAECHGQRVGGLGEAGCFSFYSNKLLGTGEGGMIVTDDYDTAQTARGFKDLCHSPVRFLHNNIGWNYRLTNLQAAIGLAQLEKLDEYVEARRRHARLYMEGLKGLDIQFPVEKDWAKNVYWMFGIVLPGGKRDEVMVKLKERGVETRSFFIPMHKQPMYREMCKGQVFPVADYISERGLYLPSGTGLKDEEIEYVCQSLRDVLEEVS